MLCYAFFFSYPQTHYAACLVFAYFVFLSCFHQLLSLSTLLTLLLAGLLNLGTPTLYGEYGSKRLITHYCIMDFIIFSWTFLLLFSTLPLVLLPFCLYLKDDFWFDSETDHSFVC